LAVERVISVGLLLCVAVCGSTLQVHHALARGDVTLVPTTPKDAEEEQMSPEQGLYK